MSWIFNGPGVLQGEVKNKDAKSQRIEITAGMEIPDGFLDENTMKYLDKQGKIVKRTFIDEVRKPKAEKKKPEEKSEE